MPGSATSYLRQNVLGHTLNFATYARPGAVYVGLCTSAPSATTGGLEIVATGTGYARSLATMALSSGRTDLAVNNASIEFPPAATNWGSIGWFELWDALTVGNRLYWGPLVDPTDGTTPLTRSVVSGDVLRLSIGTLTVQAI